ncbi:hypothetical protein MMMB2_2179 [Mycobacterium marinum MB2]|nr:hypothetical protein MMMB2_2179 [Mycobacterium marinum MB2]
MHLLAQVRLALLGRCTPGCCLQSHYPRVTGVSRTSKTARSGGRPAARGRPGGSGAN